MTPVVVASARAHQVRLKGGTEGKGSAEVNQRAPSERISESGIVGKDTL